MHPEITASAKENDDFENRKRKNENTHKYICSIDYNTKVLTRI